MGVPDVGGTWSSQDSRAIAGMYTEDGVRHVIAGDIVCRGREEIIANVQGLIDVLDGEKVEVRKVSEGSDGTVTVEWVLLGTHVKDAPGWPAKNEALNLLGVSVCDMEGDLIKEERVYWDAATLLAGAGVLG